MSAGELDTAEIRARWNVPGRCGAHELYDINAMCDTLDEARAEIARLRAGEDASPRDEACWPTPGQWIRWWNELAAEDRLVRAAQVIEQVRAGTTCWDLGHDARIRDLDERARAHVDAREAAVEQVNLLAGRLEQVREWASINEIAAVPLVWRGLGEILATLEGDADART